MAKDNELIDSHVLNICSKANKKLSVLCRLSRCKCRLFGIFQQQRTLFKLFFKAQFKYSPLIWIFCTRSANNKINKFHKRALRLVYNDYNSKFEELLTKDSSFTIHHQNIRDWN